MSLQKQIPIDELNNFGCEEFIKFIGWVFEDSPWVAEQTWLRRPFADLEALHKAMIGEVMTADIPDQLALLRAHPDLGSRVKMTDASTSEQAGAGLDQLTREEFEQLCSMNRLYRDKMGFSFLFAVKGSTKYDILEELKRRVGEDPTREFQEALRQSHQIALFRLEDIIMRKRC